MQFTSIIVFFAVVLPVVFAWHAFVARYLLASFFAALNVMVLLGLLLALKGQAGHYLGGMLLLSFVVTFLAALLIGLPFLLSRRKASKQDAEF